MSVALWLTLFVGAGPSVRVESCPEGWLDARQVRAQLAIAHVVFSEDVVVRCEGSGVVLTHGAETRALTLSGATAEQRQRTLSLFLASWLAPGNAQQHDDGRQAANPFRLSALDGGALVERRGDVRAASAGLDAGALLVRKGAATDLRELGLDAGAFATRQSTPADLRGVDVDAGSIATRQSSPADLRTVAVDAGFFAVRQGSPADSREVAVDTGAFTTRQSTPTSSRDAGVLAESQSTPTESRTVIVGDARGASPGDLVPLDAGTSVAETLGASLQRDAGLSTEESTVPIELGLVPGIGLNRLFSEPTLNHFALGLIGVSSTRVDGASFGLITLSRGPLRGFQLGGVAVAGAVRGAQWGVVSVADDVQGFQLAPVAVASELTGVQFAGLLANTSHDVAGLQASAFNRAGHTLRGVQFGGLNVAGEVFGAQLGIINIADDVTGMQVGFLNVARKMVGTQLGVINISRDGPAPIGPFNVTDDAPMRLAVTLGDTHLLNVALKSGGSRLYGVLSLGWVPRAAVRAGGGLGLRLGSATELGWFGEVELVSHAVLNLESLSLGAVPTLSLGVNAGYRLAPRLALILGVQASLFFGTPSFPGNTVSLFGIPLGTGGVAFGPGAQFGIEL